MSYRSLVEPLKTGYTLCSAALGVGTMLHTTERVFHNGMPRYERLAQRDPYSILERPSAYAIAATSTIVASGFGAALTWPLLGAYAFSLYVRK